MPATAPKFNRVRAMATSTATTLAASNLRTSSRQTRTNPARTSKIVGSSLRQNSLISNPVVPPVNTNEPHGFYPAITHFTDAITALPREYRRHTSLLKEVDAKAWAPEENLQTLLTACIASRPAREASTSLQNADEASKSTAEPQTQQNAPESVTLAAIDDTSQTSAASVDPVTLQRRRLFYDLRNNLTEMMVTMDEKNHVINNANEELSRHLRRLEAIFPHIASEVSEEARLGSLTHWAYLENRVPARATGHTSRREAAASLATMHETDIASRSESRREAMLARKQRQTHVDSDFDEQRNSNRRNNSNGKTRRIGEIAAEAGLGISNAGSAPKRKKVERPAGGSVTAEVVSARSNAGGASMSREPSQQDGVSKKRKAPTSGINTARKRYERPGFRKFATNHVFGRLATNASATYSPALISSPISGAFGKDAHRGSPALSAVRPQSSRARQNPTQTVESTRARPASSTAHKNASIGNGLTASTPELQNVAATTGKSAAEVKSTMKESTNNRGDRLVEDNDLTVNGTNGESVGESVRGGILLERSSSKLGSLKREADGMEESLTKNGASPRLAQSALATERPSRGRSSKTATPIIGTFAESLENIDVDRANGLKSKRPQPRSRMKDQLQDSLSPTGLPVKRSHKKGAGLAAQAAAMQAKRVTKDPAEDAASSMADGEQEDDDEEANGEEAIYCYCQGISYGEMVACDAQDCPREWFHLECVGLEKAPGKNSKSERHLSPGSQSNTDTLSLAKWYCDDCKENLKKAKFGSVGGNGK